MFLHFMSFGSQNNSVKPNLNTDLLQTTKLQSYENKSEISTQVFRVFN